MSETQLPAITLTNLARELRNEARGLAVRSETIQSALFGSEPRPVADNAKQAEETVEGLMREALAVMRDAESQFARTISRISELSPLPSVEAVGSSRRW